MAIHYLKISTSSYIQQTPTASHSTSATKWMRNIVVVNTFCMTLLLRGVIMLVARHFMRHSVKGSNVFYYTLRAVCKGKFYCFWSIPLQLDIYMDAEVLLWRHKMTLFNASSLLWEKSKEVSCNCKGPNEVSFPPSLIKHHAMKM